ncbi:hypothetical protein THAOC_37365 [Thalassiosira oceanica]|uniref:RING-type domain-containing protein n=1 Tax=Thalassiosira oceanica TaxID=159749 RepID=K0QYG9_THAOC|nr:hypothetical protein THAOC_37365 [Thalassiosira oceanica]|eukprot:EJK44123.1 hypothetical protein THAOC_37365 [Thalassiosira oceanica]
MPRTRQGWQGEYMYRTVEIVRDRPQTKVAAKETEVGKLKTKNAELQRTISRWSERGRQLNAQLADKDAEIIKLKSKRTDHLSLTKSKLEAAEVMVSRWSEYGRKLQAQLAGKDAEIKKLKSKRMDISLDLNISKSKLKATEAKVKILEGENRKLLLSLTEKETEMKEISCRDEASSMGSNISGLCIVCHGNEANVAIVPCGHICLCTLCSGEYTSRQKNCPMCCRRPQHTHQEMNVTSLLELEKVALS